jgi:hypothetical protein
MKVTRKEFLIFSGLGLVAIAARKTVSAVSGSAKAAAPAKATAIVSSVVATGRRMKGSEMFMLTQHEIGYL